LYANRLRFAALRLGSSFLFVSKNSRLETLSVGYLSTALSAQLGEPSAFVFAHSLLFDRIVTEKGCVHKNIILRSIAKHFTEAQLMGERQRGNYLYVFDLKTIPTRKGPQLEFYMEASSNEIHLQTKEGAAEASLRRYFEHLYQRPALCSAALSINKSPVLLVDSIYDLEAMALQGQAQELVMTLPEAVLTQGKVRIFRRTADSGGKRLKKQHCKSSD